MGAGSLGKEARTQTPPNWWRSHSPPSRLRDSLGLGTAQETDQHLQAKPRLLVWGMGMSPTASAQKTLLICVLSIFPARPQQASDRSNSKGSGSQTGDQNAEGGGLFSPMTFKEKTKFLSI